MWLTRSARLLAVTLVAALASGCTNSRLQSTGKTLTPDAAKDCYSCAQWNQPQQPFRIYGNTYYVGLAGISAVLVDGGTELVLIDGGLPQSAELILASIRHLGFDPGAISTILLSHAHYDHAGGINALQRYTGARVLASEAAAAALRQGDLMPDDPQFNQPYADRSFPAVMNVAEVADGAEVSVGRVLLRGVFTPGHTPGGMSWTWESCEQDRCLDIVYADSIGPVAAETYRFSEGLGDALASSARKMKALDCDVLLVTHPFAFDMQRKYEQGRPAFIDPQACAAYAEATLRKLEERLLSEQSGNSL
jgi:metallo-beta-lactamase class B